MFRLVSRTPVINTIVEDHSIQKSSLRLRRYVRAVENMAALIPIWEHQSLVRRGCASSAWASDAINAKEQPSGVAMA
jgi:hypothetical protein